MTDRMFTQEQAQAMYEFVKTVAYKHPVRFTSGSYPLFQQASRLLETLQVIDSDSAAPPSPPLKVVYLDFIGRYKVEHAYVNPLANHIFPTAEAAQMAIDRLNEVQS